MYLMLFYSNLEFLPTTTKLRRLCFYSCVSVHRGGVWSRGLVPGGLAQGECLLWGPGTQGGSVPGGVPGRGVLLLGGVSQHALRQTATVADGTHPTGMHSCNSVKLICSFLKNISDGSKWEMRQPAVKSCLFHENVRENLVKNYVGTPPLLDLGYPSRKCWIRHWSSVLKCSHINISLAIIIAQNNVVVYD